MDINDYKKSDLLKAAKALGIRFDMRLVGVNMCKLELVSVLLANIDASSCPEAARNNNDLKLCCHRGRWDEKHPMFSINRGRNCAACYLQNALIQIGAELPST